jgi:hypothetical protein
MSPELVGSPVRTLNPTEDGLKQGRGVARLAFLDLYECA